MRTGHGKQRSLRIFLIRNGEVQADERMRDAVCDSERFLFMNSAKRFTKAHLQFLAVVGPKNSHIIKEDRFYKERSYQSGLPSPLTFTSAKSS
jgi:hypothetical protein